MRSPAGGHLANQGVFGIANVFSRSPAVLASTAATLARTRETVALCRKIWARDPSPFEGRFFNTRGVKLAFKPLREDIPIWHGAVLEKGLQACSEVADGWIPANLPAECIAWGRELLGRSSAEGMQESSNITIAPTFQLLAGENAEQMLPLVKFGIAMYYGQPGSPYARAAAALGYEEDIQLLQAAYKEGGSEKATTAVSDRLANSVGIVGSVSECRTRIDQLLASGADRLIVTMPAATRAECEPLLEGIIPDRYR